MAKVKQTGKLEVQLTPSAGTRQPTGKEQTEALINYKGIYFEDENDKKYTCPKTGAHFEFNDMSRRLKKVQARRS